MYFAGLVIERIGPNVSDMRIGQGHELLVVRRIGQDFLIAGHRRIEYDFPDGIAVGTDRQAVKDRAISQR